MVSEMTTMPRIQGSMSTRSEFAQFKETTEGIHDAKGEQDGDGMMHGAEMSTNTMRLTQICGISCDDVA